ncbi:ubiquitin activating enzyme [Trypanosoma conorhini]|uniref:NEDD8-activating enzyme E1 regulatory subunit n=1 Tax=Trypanosoma conorhini TaxID=83891 RepID=A0A422PPQ7_9TRYP|nr:ubiquitin activating enzyme [Trypanosoma conorhini]RNF19714.1 ubiquitin activating enzyme [Trypanosoma conorhini]
MSGTKYDRQLRLWSHAGQRSLTEAHIVVLGATAAAAEVLKNVVLPGIGFYTVVDDARVDEEAVGNNFFVSVEDYNARRPLSEALLQHLSLLNPQAHGMACVESCVAWVEEFLLSGTQACATAAGVAKQRPPPSLIVVTPRLPAVSLRRLSAWLKGQRGPPLVYVQAVGLIGLIHVQEGERLIIHAEPKPESCVADLRIFNPFPELKAWFDSHDPEDDALFRDDIELHSHLPWIAILYHALQRIRRDRGAPEFVPHSKADYDAVRMVVGALIRRPTPPQEGFMEAMERCRVSLNRPSLLPGAVQKILRDPRTDAPWLAGTSFEGPGTLYWLVLHGIKRFMQEHDAVPPFCGYVPDFTTTTQWYGELCGIYEQKMKDDCAAVWGYAMEALAACSNGGYAPVVNADEVAEVTRTLVQNLWTLQLAHFGPGLDEVATDAPLRWQRVRHYFAECSTEAERFTVELYTALLAAHQFEEQVGRPPGRVPQQSAEPDATWESDSRALLRIIERSWQGRCCGAGLTAKACMEVARFGAGEPAATACIVGAAAAQECIKLVQHRRVPIQRPLIFDGYRCCFWLAPPPPPDEVEEGAPTSR